jgi:hypothetical protein
MKNYTLQLKVFTHFIKPGVGGINLPSTMARIEALFTAFICCFWRSIDTFITLIDPQNVCKNFRFNENFNAAAVESPPSVHKIMNFYRMMSVRLYLLFMDYPENEVAAKLVQVNEKPNYNSRIRKTKPYCTT